MTDSLVRSVEVRRCIDCGVQILSGERCSLHQWAPRGHTSMEPEMACTYCGRIEIDCICEEIGCLDLEDQLDVLLADEDQTHG